MPAMFVDSVSRGCCAHCGLPLPGTALEEAYCCHACRLVARIVGANEQGDRAWQFLKLGVGTLLAMNVMMISLLLYTGEVEVSAIPVFRKAMLILSSLALTILLSPLIAGAVQEARGTRMSLDSLVTGGSLAAFFVSAVNTIRGSGHVYFDTATMLPVLLTFGKIIESTAKTRAGDLIRSLENIIPPTAMKIEGLETREIPAAEACPGDLIRVLPGQRIPVDGTIVDGSTVIEEAAITGEALPVARAAGESVIAGTVNGTGSIVVEVTRHGGNTILHRIQAMTEAALRRPAQTERMAEKAAMIFVPVVLSVAIFAAIYWTTEGDPVKGALSALSVLVVACPCTLGVATPLATSVAISRAARAGIVVRGGDVMERIGNTELVAFDKTGTLTELLPRVKEVVIVDPECDESEILGWLAPLEEASEHPLAKTVVDAAYSSRRLDRGAAHHVKIFPGSGLSGVVTRSGKTRTITAGTAAFVGIDDLAVPCEDTLSEIWMSWNGKVRGGVRCLAPVRAEAAETIQRLRRSGIDTLLISGDRRPVAEAVGRQLGLDRVEAPCTPEAKLRFVTCSTEMGRPVMMVGDGVNDAPALAASPVGVALGAMDLARQAGNVVVTSRNLAVIPWLIRLSRKSRTIIRQNFAWCFGYNTIALAAAAAGVLHPLLAAVAMVVSGLTVIANSSRISRFPDA